MNRFTILSMLVVVAPGTARAFDVKLCVKTDVDYVDAGIGEDYWTTAGPTVQFIRGATFQVYKGPDLLFGGYLGDGIGTGDPGIGCTSTFSVASAGTLDLYLTSRGYIQGNELIVTDTNGSPRTEVGSQYVSTAATYNVTIDTTGVYARFVVFNVFQAMAYALYRHAGGMTGDGNYYVEVGNPTGCSPNGSSCNDHDAGIIYISADTTYPYAPYMADNKFLIVHELGHRLGDLKTEIYGEMMNEENDCSLDDAAEACVGDDPHLMISGEYAGCAVAEGFAHFYSADVWNNHAQTGCWFRSYNPGDLNVAVNCESASTDYPLSFIEDCAGRGTEGSPNLAGCGVELDWLRTFWDVHTNSGGGLDPSFTDIVSWIATADDWTEDTAYNELEEEADALNDNLEANWDAVKGSSGSEPNSVAHSYP